MADSRDGKIYNDRIPKLYEGVLSKETYTPISKEEEAELFKRLGKDSRDTILLKTLRTVVSIARQYLSYGVPFEVLISEGVDALFIAFDTFDPEKGAKFNSRAIQAIYQRLEKLVDEQGNATKLPPKWSEIVKDVYLVTRQKEQEQSGAYDIFQHIEELAREVSSPRWQISPNKLKEILSFYTQNNLSLDDPVYDDDSSNPKTFHEEIKSYQSSPEEVLFVKLAGEELEDIFDTLSEREKEVLTLYYGLRGEDPMIDQQIGDRIGLGRTGAQNIRMQAIAKLQKRIKGRTKTLLEERLKMFD